MSDQNIVGLGYNVAYYALKLVKGEETAQEYYDHWVGDQRTVRGEVVVNYDRNVVEVEKKGPSGESSVAFEERIRDENCTLFNNVEVREERLRFLLMKGENDLKRYLNQEANIKAEMMVQMTIKRQKMIHQSRLEERRRSSAYESNRGRFDGNYTDGYETAGSACREFDRQISRLKERLKDLLKRKRLKEKEVKLYQSGLDRIGAMKMQLNTQITQRTVYEVTRDIQAIGKTIENIDQTSIEDVAMGFQEQNEKVQEINQTLSFISPEHDSEEDLDTELENIMESMQEEVKIEMDHVRNDDGSDRPVMTNRGDKGKGAEKSNNNFRNEIMGGEYERTGNIGNPSNMFGNKSFGNEMRMDEADRSGRMDINKTRGGSTRRLKPKRGKLVWDDLVA